MNDNTDQRWISPEDYLAIERQAEVRGEYRDGQIRRMPPSNLNHNRIVVNLLGEIGSQTKALSHQVLAIKMMILVRETGLFAYPDLVVVKDRAECLDPEEYTLLNPCLLIEVVSPATEEWDRNVKSAHYRRLASLDNYVLVSQDEVLVEHYSRRGDEWLLKVTDRLDQTLLLPSISCEVLLSEIYAKVFPPFEVMHCERCEISQPTERA